MSIAATHIIHLVEDIFAETALVEERDFLISKDTLRKFFKWLEETFMQIAFYEANETLVR